MQVGDKVLWIGGDIGVSNLRGIVTKVVHTEFVEIDWTNSKEYNDSTENIKDLKVLNNNISVYKDVIFKLNKLEKKLS